ncbi:MAG: peptidoglycan-binding protein [Rhodobacter sp.]|nr:peptidoglycan-binding protein [Rhodobacter sp.]
MLRMIARAMLAAGGVLAAPLAWAADVAVLIGNDNYQNYPRFRGAGAVMALAEPLERAGFEVIAVRNLTSDLMDTEFDRVGRELRSADRILIVTAGHVGRTGRDNWLLTVDAARPDPFTVGRYGLSIGALLDAAGRTQGSAIVAITEDGGAVEPGPRLFGGFRPGDIPQGVTVMRGPVGQVVRFLGDQMLVPGRPMSDAVNDRPSGVVVQGFIAHLGAFLPRAEPPVLRPRPPNTLIERSFWQRSRSLNTIDAYRQYLARYPNGLFAQEARQRIAALRVTPEDRARMAEEALNLTRQQRRSIQENLTLLGFDTRGIDGIFGNRTRQAVRDWQANVGIVANGYLTANQITRIESQAARRAAELRAEAERRRAERERRDRLYWQQTGSNGSEAGLRAYLKRYPDGLYSDEAEARLREIEREKRRLARAEERAAWDQAVMQGTLRSYTIYLRDYPEGRFAEEAKARIASLREPETPPAVVAAAKQEEANLGLNSFRRQLIEGQLQSLNFDPGVVDGQFDGDTRRALRRFQRANSMPVTGFVTRDTIVRLLAAAIESQN